MERRNSDRPVPPPHRVLAPEGSRAFGHIALQHRHNRGPEGRARHAGLTSAGNVAGVVLQVAQEDRSRRRKRRAALAATIGYLCARHNYVSRDYRGPARRGGG
jgi:hypothetical protein